MDQLFETNVRIQIAWLEDVQRLLIENGRTYKPGDNGEIDQIYKAINVLYRAPKTAPSSNVPNSSHYQVEAQWTPLMHDELFEFNARGDEYICSTTEALIKCNGIKRKLDQFESPTYYRGETNFGWELISKLGRTNNVDWDKDSETQVTDIELELMADFQKRVNADNELKEKIFGDRPVLSFDDSGWWSLMQHYDESYGTRLIDITSSLFCGLYFACVSWDGSIDDTVDGKLYMFPCPPGRDETDVPDRIRGQLIGPDDQSNRELDAYFTIESSVDYPRFRKSPIINDRALSQDGYFVWQPRFDAPLRTFQIYPFRVHRDFKSSIVKELQSMGYTRDRILSKNRFR